MSNPNIIDISNDSMNKGEVREGKQLVAWDCIQQCNPEACPIGNRCTYIAADQDKCQLQAQYLMAFTNMICTTYRYMNDDILYKVGMQLVPLYSMLCRQKIVEKSVGNIAYEDAKGITRIHPIYKEIRETMKTIAVISKEIGFTNVVDPDLPAVGKDGYGDAGHYERLTQNADNKRDVIR